MNRKYLVIALFMVLFLGVLAASAQTTTPTTTQPQITAQDLGVSEPTLLPSSPFYFLKDWGRAINLFFTFNPLSKAELELRYESERALEARAVANNQTALTKAINNYLSARQDLGQRLKNIQDTSKNPNVSDLLNKFLSQSQKHEELFKELAKQADEAQKTKIKDIEDTVNQQSADLPLQFEDATSTVQRLSEIINSNAEGDFKGLQKAIQINDLINASSDNELKSLLEDVKASSTDEFKSEFHKQKDGSEKLKNFLENLQENEDVSSADLEDLKGAVDVAQIQNIINQAQQNELDSLMQNPQEGANKAQEAINEAQDKLNEIKDKFDAVSNQLSAQDKNQVQSLINLATDKLITANDSLTAQKYGEAYGNAIAANSLARNAERYLEKSSERESEQNATSTERNKKDREEMRIRQPKESEDGSINQSDSSSSDGERMQQGQLQPIEQQQAPSSNSQDN